MKALVIGAGGQGTAPEGRALRLAEVPEPSRAGECRIRVLLAGICGTDLQLLSGYANFTGIPGHEFVGVVEDAPATDRRWIGRRVVGEINVGCGACEWCRTDVPEHCSERSVLGIRRRAGAFAEYLWLPAANLYEVPESLDNRAAVFTEPLAAACQILSQVEFRPSMKVAVMGDGRLGLLTAQVLASAGVRVVLFGKNPKKLRVARGLAGVDARRLDAAAPPPARSFDVVVEATGRPDGFGRSLALVRPRGALVLKSTFHGSIPAELWPAVVNEVTIVGSRCGPFDRALALLERGIVKTEPLISAELDLIDYEAAFATARKGLKVLLRPQARPAP